MKLIVNPHKIELIQEQAVNEKEINVSYCEFEFSDEITDDFVKEAYFTLDNATYKQIIVDNKCSFPQEVLVKEATIELGVVATYTDLLTDEIIRYNPTPVYFKTDLGSLKDAENSQPITPSEMEQYEQALNDGLETLDNALDDLQEKVDSDYFKGDKGDTGEPGPEGPAGRDGAIQYTAGENITIENDVISAIVSTYDGEEVHTFECTSTNPFVFDGKKKGVYINKKYENNTFYYKWSESTPKNSILNSYPFMIILPNDYTYVPNQWQNNLAIIYMYDASFVRLKLVNISKSSSDILSQSGGNILYFLNDTTQAIYGVKTFVNIPKQDNTTAPTQDAEFTNKKYVDSKTWVGTQAEYDAITTPSEDTIYFIKEDTNAS